MRRRRRENNENKKEVEEEEGIKTFRRENNKIIEEGIKKLRREKCGDGWIYSLFTKLC